jgi:alkylation response protein AidB-like acyl-CoA dehydrogenase
MMDTDKPRNYRVPSQTDEGLRLNPAPDKNPHWSEQVKANQGDEKLHLPETESWRQYDPAKQTREYEFLLKDVLKIDALDGKVTGYDKESVADHFVQLKRFEGMATAMHAVSHKGARDPVQMRAVYDKPAKGDEPAKKHIETFLPPYIHDLHQKFSADGWNGMAIDKKYGGMGLPHAFSGAMGEMLMAANPGYAVLEDLSKSVSKAIAAKGGDELKAQWLPRINSGRFSGAMVMTELNYGSSLKDMETTVQLDETGKVGKVYGYKRFISSADHDATVTDRKAARGEKGGERNIVHMVLARTADKDGNLMGMPEERVNADGFILEKDRKTLKLDELSQPVKGKPTSLNADGFILNPDKKTVKLFDGKPKKGTAQLSLVLVPRVLLDEKDNYVDQNGKVVDKPDTNNVRIAKLNDKMGLEVQSNTDVAYDGAKGWIVGNVGDGMKNMFVIMNEARLGVGLQGTGIAELLRQNVERYAAEERKQGAAGHIINYPDMQDKILTMRAHIEAGRSIAADVGIAFDQVLHAAPEKITAEEKAELQKYVSVMTPLVKWGLTEGGGRAIGNSVMGMGGAGYMREWGMAQGYIDSIISRIYEGSNPVLASAEINRELGNMDAFLNKTRRDMAELDKDKDIGDITKPLHAVIKTFENATKWLQKAGLDAVNGDKIAGQEFQAAAGHYMELMYAVASGTALAKNAHAAKAKLKEENVTPEDKKFYEAKIATATYYVNAVIGQEHEMHFNKMTQNTKYLALPDRGIVKNAAAFMARGAEMITLGLIKAKDIIDGVVPNLGTDKEQGRM